MEGPDSTTVLMENVFRKCPHLKKVTHNSDWPSHFRTCVSFLSFDIVLYLEGEHGRCILKGLLKIVKSKDFTGKLQDEKILDRSKLKQIADDIFKCI